jgi:hypothetical protein
VVKNVHRELGALKEYTVYLVQDFYFSLGLDQERFSRFDDLDGHFGLVDLVVRTHDLPKRALRRKKEMEQRAD